MDEVGFMVTHVDQRGGFLRIAPLGGLDAWTMLGQEVMLRNKEGELVRGGVVGVDPPPTSGGTGRPASSRSCTWMLASPPGRMLPGLE